MKDSIAVAKKAADAAELNAKAAIGVELPIIQSDRFPGLIAADDELEPSDFPQIFRTGGVYQSGTPRKNNVLSGIEFRNFGRTSAFPNKMDVGWMVAPALPDEPNYFCSVNYPPAAIIKEDGNSTPAPRIDRIVELSEDDRKSLSDGTAILWVYVALHYADFLNLPHETRFCWRSRTGILGRANTVPAAYTSRR